MKKICFYLWRKIKEFILNPFWSNWIIVFLIFINLGLNGWLWQTWVAKYQDLIGSVPIAYSSAVIILNIFLGNLSYRKELLISFILLGTSLMIQIIYLIFLRVFAMSQTF